MDTTILSGMAGVLGSLVGGSATVATSWISQRTLNRRELLASESSKREGLYGEFINECSARALDSFENTLDKSERLLSIYALLNRIRICASDAVLHEAEQALASIAEQYFSPNHARRAPFICTQSRGWIFVLHRLDCCRRHSVPHGNSCCTFTLAVAHSVLPDVSTSIVDQTAW
jgi:hypothetical protein